MIKDHDRSGWFGASDTNIIMGNWNTKTFCRWWLEKLGLIKNTYSNIYMITGTHFEHKILDYAGIKKRDRQIKKRKYRLKVNLDGETKHRIQEVKTYSSNEFKISKPYWQQAQVQMFAAEKELDILAYRLEPDDYINFYRDIDGERLTRLPVEYDERFINDNYLPRLIYLHECLMKRKTP